jgi:glycerol-3-phosphate cytidylyltransferase-like family protein
LHRKSKYKPVIPLYERYKTLLSIKYIDAVYTYQTEEDLLNLITFWKPDVRILGEDYIGKSFTGDDLPIEVIYTTRSHNWSTTKLKDLITKQTIKQNPSILDDK